DVQIKVGDSVHQELTHVLSNKGGELNQGIVGIRIANKAQFTNLWKAVANLGLALLKSDIETSLQRTKEGAVLSDPPHFATSGGESFGGLRSKMQDQTLHRVKICHEAMDAAGF